MANRTASEILYSGTHSRAKQILQNAGLDSWTLKNHEYRQSMRDLGGYLDSGNLTAAGNEKYRASAQKAVDDLTLDMQSYGKNSDAYSTLSSYRDYYNNALGYMRNDDLNRGTQSLTNYLTEGKYTAADNASYRQTATKMVQDLTDEMTGYKKDSDYYNMLDGYRQYYQEALNTFDYTDVGAAVNDYNTSDSWHSEEDYTTQRDLLTARIAELDDQMSKIEDKTSAEYGRAKTYKDWYDELLGALDSRHEVDAYFKTPENYALAQKVDDYEYSAQLKKTLSDLTTELKDLGVDPSAGSQSVEKQLNRIIASKESDLVGLQAYGGDPAEIAEAEKRIRDLYGALDSAKQLDKLQADVSQLTEYRTSSILNNYGGYDINADYEQMVADLKEQRDLAAEGSVEREKLDAEIYALAGPNGDGKNADGTYNEYTLLGRSALDHFNLEDGQKNLDVLDQILSLYSQEDAKRAEILQMQQNGVASEEMYSKEEQIAYAQKELDRLTAERTKLQEEHPEYAADEISLKGKRTDLSKMIMSATDQQNQTPVDTAYSSRSPEDQARLVAAGEAALYKTGAAYINANKNFISLPHFDELTGEDDQWLRDRVLAAIGAEMLGEDIGYTVEDALRAYQPLIEQAAGKNAAEKISNIKGGFWRWNTQVLGVGALTGLNQAATGFAQFLSSEPLRKNKIDYLGAYTREDLKRYGDEDIFGSNISQILFDTTQTTANMLPMIVASTLTSGAAGAAGAAAATAGKIGAAVGAGVMGISSAGNAYNQAISEGWKKEDARVFALITGAAEASMQYAIGGITALGGVTEEGLLKAANGINNAAVRVATKTGIHILSETTEELAQNRLERYLTYQMSGKGDADWWSWTDDDWYTVIVTALSTGAMEGPGEIFNDITQQRVGKLASGETSLNAKQVKALQSAKINKQNAQMKLLANNVGEYMKSSDALAYTLLAIGEDLPSDGVANDLATRMDNGKIPKNAANYGALFAAILSENGDLDKSMASIIGGALVYNDIQKTESELNAAQERHAQLKAANPGATVLDEVSSRLTELNGDPVLSVKTAAVIHKVLDGTAISKNEMSEIAGDSNEAAAARVYLAEVTGDTRFTADMREAYAVSAVEQLIETKKTEKAAKAAQMKAAVSEAAKEAAAKVELDRATAGADGTVATEAAEPSVAASDVRELQQAKRDVELAKQKLESLRNMKFEDAAAAEAYMQEQSETGEAQMTVSEFKTVVDLTQRNSLLEKRISRLAEIKIPSKDQRTELQNYRREYAENEAKKNAIIDGAEARLAEQEKASSAEQTAPTQEQGGPTVIQPAAQTGKVDSYTTPNGTVITRAEYVQQQTTGENAVTPEVANANFDRDAAMAGAVSNNNGGIVNEQQTAGSDQGRVADVGRRGESAENSEQADQTAQPGEEAGGPRLRAIRDDLEERVSETAKIFEDTDDLSEHEQTYKGLRAFTDALKASGFKRITYVVGELFNKANQPVPAAYNNKELILRLDNRGYRTVAEHEKGHLRLDYLRDYLGDERKNAFVSGALQSMLSEDEYRKAFMTYLNGTDPEIGGYGDAYSDMTIDEIAHRINEEILCDMIAGLNTFKAGMDWYQESAKDYLDASNFDSVTQALADGLTPGVELVESEDVAENRMPYGVPTDTLINTEHEDAPSTAVASIQSVSKNAMYGWGRSLGFSIDGENKIWYKTPEDAKNRVNGFTEVSADDVENSPLGELIEYANHKGYISEESMRRQFQLFADIATITEKTVDLYSAMQFYGSVLFTAMKLNSDKQYGLSEDIANICTKTQSMIDGMSEAMKRVKRGLNDEEILEIYQKNVANGLPVNCPECYVFSRWIGIGGLLDNIYRYQERFSQMSVEEVAKTYDELFDKVINRFNTDRTAFIDKAVASGMSREEAEAEARKKFSKGKSRSKLVKEAEKEYNDLLQEQEDLKAQGKDLPPEKAKKLKDKEKEALSLRALVWINNVYFGGKDDHSAKSVNPNFAVPSDILFDLNAGEEFALHYPEAWAFRTTQGAGYGKAIVPTAEANLGESILVTANTGYLKRKTDAARKYAGNDVDERHRAADAGNIFLSQRGPIRGTKKGTRGAALKTTTTKNLNQLFLGGQRLQSTSDSRFDTAIDTLMIMTELQAMHGGAQIYTKVLGAVPFYDATGGFVNMSAMPFGGGLDKNGNPIDTPTGGVNMEQAIQLREQCPHAGTITIGVNDAHIRAMFKQVFRDFIIPYHASGGKISIVAEMRRIQEGIAAGKYKMPQSTDYTLTQTDKFLSDTILKNDLKLSADEIEEIHRFRDMRIWILTGGSKGVEHPDLLLTDGANLTRAQRNARTILQELYTSTLPGGKWNGLSLAKGVIEGQIFPNEFWNTKATYDGRNGTEHSSVNTQRYLDYCEALGVLHRFSGKGVKTGKAPTVDGGMVMRGHIYNVNGRDQNGVEVPLTDLAYQVNEDGSYVLDEYGEKVIEPYFWKTLTDHRMYGNEGEYLEQKAVTLDGLLGLDNENAEEAVAKSAETFASKTEGFAHPTGAVTYNRRKSMELAKQPLSTETKSKSRYSIAQEVDVDDVVTAGNGELAVRIDSKESGLNRYPKGQWGAVLRDQIRRELVGKTIVTEDGDLISFKDRSAREPTFGIAAKKMLSEAAGTKDYSKINQKWLTLDHLASLVALSKFKSWSENTKTDDWFKRDGINHRSAILYVDGAPYEVDIATALNTNEEDAENYGDKFYDIKISEEPSAKNYGDPREGSSPYKIKYADDSSDKLSVAQKERAVKNAGLKFTSEKQTGGSAMANAFANPGKIRTKSPSRYALANLDHAIEPSTDKWQRDHTTEEVKAMYPGLWDITADESETRNPTQVRDTVKTYRKIYDILKAEGFNGTILDASSGLGDGTRAGREEYGFDVEDIEPYPDKNYSPKYTDYDNLNKKYDVIISNAVLNVLPQDQRDALAVKMGELLNPGGRIFINVRGDDVRGNKSNQPVGGKWEYYVASTGSYQKGFTTSELQAYLQDALGDGFTVEPTRQFGKSAVVVTKDGGKATETTKPIARYSLPFQKNASDAERYRYLRDARITPAVYDSNALDTNLDLLPGRTVEEKFDSLKEAKKADIKRALKTLAAKLGVTERSFHTDSIDLDFRYSGRAVGESAQYQNQDRLLGLAKALTVFDRLAENAVPIDIRDDAYSGKLYAEGASPTETWYSCLSAYRDGDKIVPVKISIDERKNTENRAHLMITFSEFEPVKNESRWGNNVIPPASSAARKYASRDHVPPLLDISVAEIVRNVKSDEYELLRDIPDGLLSEAQIQGKAAAQDLFQRHVVDKIRDRAERKGIDSDYVDQAYDEAAITGDRTTAEKLKPYTVQPLFSLYKESDTSNPYPENTLQHDFLNAIRSGDAEGLSSWIDRELTKNEDAKVNAKITAPRIPSKNFVPAVSDQENSFLDSLIKSTIKTQGQMSPSEKSNGFVIPAKNQQGERFRKFIQNAGSAKQISEPAQRQLKRFAFTDVHATYTPDSNERDLRDAKDLIKERGLTRALDSFQDAARDFERISMMDLTKKIALGEQLLIETSQERDMKSFLDVLTSLTMLSTQAGKSLQAFRMLKESGPIGELYYVQKTVEKMNKKYRDKIEHGAMPKITVSDEDAKAVINAPDEAARDKAMDTLMKHVAAQVPVTLADKWNAWRYLAMLGNARTHIRNVVGNAVFVPLRYAKDLMAAGGEFLATKAGLMEEQDRTKAVSVSRELRDFAKSDAEVMRKELQGNGKYNPAREIMEMRKILPGFLDKASKTNGNLLEYEDWLFLSPAYQNALAQALSHSGFTVDELQGTVEGQKALSNARRIAINEAQKATYRDFSAMASSLNRIKQNGKFGGVLLEGILPFTKTPINILKRGVEYSPVGIATSIFEAIKGVKDGNLDVAQFIDHLSAGLSGTAVAVLGFLLARMGVLRGKKDDKEEDFEKLQGYQDYSVKIGNQTFTIDWAAPTALPLFTGAAVNELMNGGELGLGDAWDAMMMIAEPMMSLSMLDGLNSVLSATAYADENQKVFSILQSALTSYLGQAFPTVLGQAARTIDGTRRATYVDKNSDAPAWLQRFVQSSVQGKIPVWESQKMPYVDAWGRESTASSKLLNGFENFFTPWYRSVVNTTDIDDQLNRLYQATKDSDVLPSSAAKNFSVNGETKDLTADEYVSYATDVGQTKYSLLTQMLYDSRYLALSDEQKVIAVGEIYKYANTAGKYHIDQSYDLHKQGAWIEEAEAAATDIARYDIIWAHIEKKLGS